ncbi:MAG: threonine/serine exporter family protein [Lachnospiraceae bacterium]|nr:threonine/serine exporter family protein [Lachnospiraceae bacterium]
MLLETIATFILTVSFCVILAAPKSEWVFCGISGVFSFWANQLLLKAGAHFALATLGATMVLALVSRGLAVMRRQPVTVYLMPGIFPLAPGAGIYFTAYYLMAGDMVAFSEKGMETLETAVAIALGIVFASGLPQTNLRPKSDAGK